MELILLVGSPGAGKSTYYEKHFKDTHVRISQDEQGPAGHKIAFEEALKQNHNIVVDRQNHLSFQRKYYLDLAKENNYTTKIIWLKVDLNLCEKRIIQRGNDHPTIKLKDNVKAIVSAHRRSLETPNKNEADEFVEIYVPFYASQLDLTHLKGKIAVIGDAHGVWDEVEKALKDTQPDHVVFCGDLCDRGPDFLKLLNYVRENDNVYTVEGNHENKLARWAKGNKVRLAGGLEKTVEQIQHFTEDERVDLYQWIQSLPTMIKLPNDYVVVHAGVDPTKGLDLQKYSTCIWIRSFGTSKFDDNNQPFWFEYPLCDELEKYKILFGHSIHEKVCVARNIYSLDGGAVYGGELRIAIIDSESGEINVSAYQSKKYFSKEDEDLCYVFKKREELVDQGYLSKSSNKNLVLYNYTDKCTFDRYWIRETLSSRGTIYDKATGKVVAKAFDKYFNLEEREETKISNLPLNEKFMVFEKLDGSLGILYRQDGTFKISTRGSFYSEQALMATRMLDGYNLNNIPKNVTLLFEIIYPDNKIVVPYGEREELVVIGAFNFESGEELPWDKVVRIANQAGFGLPKVYNYTLDDLVRLTEELTFEDEGWVVRFESGLRVKIKVKDYIRMAKIISHISPLSIWEAMVEGKDEEYLVSIPEEIRQEVEDHRDVLLNQVNMFEEFIKKEYDRLGLIPIKDKEHAKEMSLIIQRDGIKELKGFLFAMVRGSDIKKGMLDKLRPKNNEFVDVQILLGEMS